MTLPHPVRCQQYDYHKIEFNDIKVYEPFAMFLFIRASIFATSAENLHDLWDETGKHRLHKRAAIGFHDRNNATFVTVKNVLIATVRQNHCHLNVIL